MTLDKKIPSRANGTALQSYQSSSYQNPRKNRCPSCGYKGAFSMSVRNGQTLYHCHVGCPQDDVLAAVRDGGGDWPQSRLSQESQSSHRHYNAGKAEFIRKLWRESLPGAGTAVETYLRSRGITTCIPVSIRLLPHHWHPGSKRKWPVMLAAVTDVNDHLQSIHRTYLSLDGKTKAPVESAKMTLGPIGGYSVHLAPAAEVMAVAEGIETALSVQQATDMPTWAALNAGGIRDLILPPLPLSREVIIAADNDANSVGQRAAHDAAQRWLAEGRRVRIALPPVVDTDFNDLLRGGTHAA